jgi:hypothetical protein
MSEKKLVEQAVPVVRRLLAAIDALFEEAVDMLTIITTLKESLGLIHINFFIHVGIQEGAFNICLFTVEVELGYKVEDYAEGGELDGGSECLIEVKTMDL